MEQYRQQPSHCNSNSESDLTDDSDDSSSVIQTSHHEYRDATLMVGTTKNRTVVPVSNLNSVDSDLEEQPKPVMLSVKPRGARFLESDDDTSTGESSIYGSDLEEQLQAAVLTKSGGACHPVSDEKLSIREPSEDLSDAVSNAEEPDVCVSVNKPHKKAGRRAFFNSSHDSEVSVSPVAYPHLKSKTVSKTVPIVGTEGEESFELSDVSGGDVSEDNLKGNISWNSSCVSEDAVIISDSDSESSVSTDLQKLKSKKRLSGKQADRSIEGEIGTVDKSDSSVVVGEVVTDDQLVTEFQSKSPEKERQSQSKNGSIVTPTIVHGSSTEKLKPKKTTRVKVVNSDEDEFKTVDCTDTSAVVSEQSLNEKLDSAESQQRKSPIKQRTNHKSGNAGSIINETSTKKVKPKKKLKPKVLDSTDEGEIKTVDWSDSSAIVSEQSLNEKLDSAESQQLKSPFKQRTNHKSGNAGSIINETSTEKVKPKKKIKPKVLDSTDEDEIKIVDWTGTPAVLSEEVRNEKLDSAESQQLKSPIKQKMNHKSGNAGSIINETSMETVKPKEKIKPKVLDNTDEGEIKTADRTDSFGIIEDTDSRFSVDVPYHSTPEKKSPHSSEIQPSTERKDSTEDEAAKKQADATHDVEQRMQSLALAEVTKSSTKQELTVEKHQLLISIAKCKMILRTTQLSSLPDGGMRVQMDLHRHEQRLRQVEKLLLTAPPDIVDLTNSEKKQDHTKAWGELTVSAQPMGKTALQTHLQQRSLTVDALKQLHGSLSTCPDENTLAEPPRGLRSSVQLMRHQLHALAWMLWREQKSPRAGILADDMGLGKTLTTITLIMADKQRREAAAADEEDVKENEDESDEDKEEEQAPGWYSSRRHNVEQGGTLVVCPASLLDQWIGEVERRCKRGALKVVAHHSQGRETSARALASADIVVTTYGIVRSEAGLVKGAVDRNKQKVLYRVHWRRIVLDEAHTVRNHKAQASQAVCALKGSRRWALTGTPVHNRELDLYAILKFLRVSPFDDYAVWRRWVDNKSAGGMQRLNTVMKTLMLRRTKEQLKNAGGLVQLPEKFTHEICVKLGKDETEVYQKMLAFSRTLFAQFLHQHEEREQMRQGMDGFPQLSGSNNNPFKQTAELRAIHNRLAAMPEVKSFEILVLLLRLRQVCCHPGLVRAMLDKGDMDVSGIEGPDGLDIDVVAQMEQLGLQDTKAGEESSTGDAKQRNVLSENNPVFEMSRTSSKMQAVYEELERTALVSGDKAIIVSQWTSLLAVIHEQLAQRGVKCAQLTGSVPVRERGAIVEKFNDPNRSPKVLLLSLTAGGVGLNLVGANHIYLVDLHWNPQLEAQACDRVYRVGQTKPVHIYRFVTEGTIEMRIQALQKSKLELANSVMSGASIKAASKLSLDDLKTLFSIAPF